MSVKNIKPHTVRVQARNLVSIPREVRECLNIGEGDLLEVRIEDNRIIMEPYKLIPADQAWFWQKQTQDDLYAALKDMESDKVRRFTNTTEFLTGLKDE